MSDIKGIPQEKLDRLWMHLEKVEELTGKLCVEQCIFVSCPIVRFASPVDKEGHKLSQGCDSGSLRYGNKYYKVYELADSKWWQSLPRETRHQITRWVMKKIREREVE